MCWLINFVMSCTSVDDVYDGYFNIVMSIADVCWTRLAQLLSLILFSWFLQWRGVYNDLGVNWRGAEEGSVAFVWDFNLQELLCCVWLHNCVWRFHLKGGLCCRMSQGLVNFRSLTTHKAEGYFVTRAVQCTESKLSGWSWSSEWNSVVGVVDVKPIGTVEFSPRVVN